MKYRWGLRVYIDPFSGPGRARIQGTKRIVETSPLIALRVPDPFDKYIFCDMESDSIAALKNRVNRDFPHANASYLVGDCNELVSKIVEEIPTASKRRTVLSFCFVDPYGMSDLKFETIRVLSKFRMDFLILLALAMDANRFESLYVKETSRAVDEFLGLADWRIRWARAKSRRTSFRHFLAREFADQMTTLGYLPAALEKMKEVRSDEKNLPLYHLAFFSKNERGYEFWKQVLKYGTDQLPLFD
jgi:three-Cys-motif partner protein